MKRTLSLKQARQSFHIRPTITSTPINVPINVPINSPINIPIKSPINIPRTSYILYVIDNNWNLLYNDYS